MASHFGNGNMGASLVKIGLREGNGTASLGLRLRIWWNWQTRYFEVVVGQPVQVQVLLCAPIFDNSAGKNLSTQRKRLIALLFTPACSTLLLVNYLNYDFKG